MCHEILEQSMAYNNKNFSTVVKNKIQTITHTHIYIHTQIHTYMIKHMEDKIKNIQ